MTTLTKHFNLEEFACHDEARTKPTGSALKNIQELAQNLEVIRAYLGCPMHVNSGFRTVAYNATLPGHSVVSQHLYGRAVDLSVPGKTPEQVAKAIEKLIEDGKIKQGGIGRYDTFTHYDIRGTRARWNYRKK